MVDIILYLFYHYILYSVSQKTNLFGLEITRMAYHMKNCFKALLRFGQRNHVIILFIIYFIELFSTKEKENNFCKLLYFILLIFILGLMIYYYFFFVKGTCL